MARIRSVKPEYWSDYDMARHSRDARLLYIALWNQSDEHGRLHGDPRWVKGHCFPYDDDLNLAAIGRLLLELEQAGKLERYTVKGAPYLYLPNLSEHQRLEPDKVASKLPAPSDADQTPPDPGSNGLHGSSSERRADSSERRADRPEKTAASLGCMEHVAGSMSLAPPPDGAKKSARAPDELWDAVVEVCHLETVDLTKSSRGACNKAVAELREVNATPGQVRTRARQYRKLWPNMTLSPSALARHWAELGRASPSSNGNQPPSARDAIADIDARVERERAADRHRMAGVTEIGFGAMPA